MELVFYSHFFSPGYKFHQLLQLVKLRQFFSRVHADDVYIVLLHWLLIWL